MLRLHVVGGGGGWLQALRILEAIPVGTLIPGGSNHAEHLKLKARLIGQLRLQIYLPNISTRQN